MHSTKILYVTDTEVRSRHDVKRTVEALRRLHNQEKPSLFLVGGDFVQTKDLQNAGARGLYEKLIPPIVELGANLVAGNHDVADDFEAFCTPMHQQGHLIGGTVVYGIPGAESRNPNKDLGFRAYRWDSEVKRIIPNFPSLDVLIAHAPPKVDQKNDYSIGNGVDYVPLLKENRGSSWIREFSESTRTDIILCGHIHEACRDNGYGLLPGSASLLHHPTTNSLAVNPGPLYEGGMVNAAVIDLRNRELTFLNGSKRETHAMEELYNKINFQPVGS